MLQWVSQHHHQMSQCHSDKFLLSCKNVNNKGVFNTLLDRISNRAPKFENFHNMTKSARLVVPEEFLTALQKKKKNDLVQQA